MKITLYFLWLADISESKVAAANLNQITEEAIFQDVHQIDNPITNLKSALEMAVNRGSLIKLVSPLDNTNPVYMLNNPQGRSAKNEFDNGDAALGDIETIPDQITGEMPNIFKLYEENIGPLTPLISEALVEAEQTYPHQWIREAFQITVENNKRSWKYTEAILKRWKQEGRDDGRDIESGKSSYKKYISGKYSEFVDH